MLSFEKKPASFFEIRAQVVLVLLWSYLVRAQLWAQARACLGSMFGTILLLRKAELCFKVYSN